MSESPRPLETAVRARCEAGDYEEAATLLVEGYGREILGFLMSRVRDAELAGDIFSTFTYDLWKGLPGFGFRSSARVWAYTLARHAASRHIETVRKDRRRRGSLSEAEGLSAAEHKVRTATLAALRTEMKERIAELRERLPSEDQSLLVLRVNRGLDWNEIAEVLVSDGEPLEPARLKREAARLRKRFQLVKARLREMAQAEGLLDGE